MSIHVRGLIPAHAGKTSYHPPLRVLEGAHPRSRGENGVADGPCSVVLGSSPLTRGKRVGLAGWLLPGRLIPAHAGKTECSPTVAHVWGLIPAHAGKTTPSRCGTGRRGAHPRSRGENALLGAAVGIGGGSSPLTRGKPAVRDVRVHVGGLIPAHAGKTPNSWTGTRSSGAHPRSRGENLTCASADCAACGSSPLTRGKQGAPERPLSYRGLIPAHAGKTRRFASAWRHGPAHPHSRRENVNTVETMFHTVGSSPLTRGKHPARGRVVEQKGLIPAHAGKTITC